jgi:hypothetical protein
VHVDRHRAEQSGVLIEGWEMWPTDDAKRDLNTRNVTSRVVYADRIEVR